jgi:hypothetical protein
MCHMPHPAAQDKGDVWVSETWSVRC